MRRSERGPQGRRWGQAGVKRADFVEVWQKEQVSSFKAPFFAIARGFSPCFTCVVSWQAFSSLAPAGLSA